MKLLPLRNLRLVMTETLKKTDDDHDSGTESDDESAEIEELQKYMEQSIQLEDGSSGHSPSRRRSATAAVLCQHTTSFRQHQPEPQQPNNKSADRRRVLPQQQQLHHHHHHHHLHTQYHPHHHSELLSGPAVVTALLTATNTAAGHQQQPCCHVVAPSVVVGGSPVLLDSALPSDSDPNLELHSSEEELEVINNRAGSAEKRKWSQANQRRARGARASLRRSRSDGGGDTSSDEEEYDAASGATLADGVSSRAMTNGACRRNTSDVEDDDDDEDDDEDDEEVRDLTWSGRGVGGAGGAGAVGEGVVNGVHGSASSAASSARSSSQRSSSSSSTAVVPPTPVEFRASPPLHVHRPYNGSPPPKVFHAAPGVVGGLSSSSSSTSLVSSSLSTTSTGATTLTLSASAHIPAFEVCAVSPRKRHRQDRGGGGTAFGVFSLVDGGPVQRPCLDFEKMQQIRVKLL